MQLADDDDDDYDDDGAQVQFPGMGTILNSVFFVVVFLCPSKNLGQCARAIAQAQALPQQVHAVLWHQSEQDLFSSALFPCPSFQYSKQNGRH